MHGSVQAKRGGRTEGIKGRLTVLFQDRTTQSFIYSLKHLLLLPQYDVRLRRSLRSSRSGGRNPPGGSSGSAAAFARSLLRHQRHIRVVLRRYYHCKFTILSYTERNEIDRTTDGRNSLVSLVFSVVSAWVPLFPDSPVLVAVSSMRQTRYVALTSCAASS